MRMNRIGISGFLGAMIGAGAVAQVDCAVHENGAPLRDYEITLTIEAPAQDVWDAFATGDGLEHWFALDARVEPGVGGTIHLSWRNEYDWASPIVGWDEGRSMKVVWPEAEGDGPRAGRFGFEITVDALDADTASLTLVHFGFPRTPEGDEMFEVIARGWRNELAVLKTALEDHAGEDRRVVYARAFLGETDPQSTWDRVLGSGGLLDGTTEPGARFAAALGGQRLVGTVRSHEAGVDLVVDLDSQGGAVLRVATEQCIVHEGRVLALFINMWDQDEEAAHRMQLDAESRLARLFGKTNLMAPIASTK